MLELLDVMPADPKKDVVPPKYGRILPKEEAPGAPAVGSIAWLFVAVFFGAIIVLDANNLLASVGLFSQNVMLLVRVLVLQRRNLRQ